MEQLEHIVIDDSDGDTIPSEQSPCACCDLYFLSWDVAQLYPSLHRCTPLTQTPSTSVPTEVMPCTPDPASSSTETSDFPVSHEPILAHPLCFGFFSGSHEPRRFRSVFQRVLMGPSSLRRDSKPRSVLVGFFFPSIDRTPHTRHWHRSVMCHASLSAACTSACHL